METPQSKLLIERFPPEILAHVVWFLAGEQLVRLKLIGTKTLWHKLKSSNVLKSIEIKKDFLPLRSWPPFLNELPSIESLCIKQNNPEWWSKFELRLNMLPSTLRKLRIEMVFWKSSLDGLFVTSNGVALHLDECLPHLDTLKLNAFLMKDYGWMKRCPPNLTHLTVPRTLNRTIPWEERKLPASLIHFGVQDDWPIESLCSPPPGLEALSLGVSFDISVNIPTLTSLEARNISGIEESPGRLSLLPKGLTCLVLSHLPTVAWNYLPTTLLRLEFISDFDDNVVTRKTVDLFNKPVELSNVLPIQLLPRSITLLRIEEDLFRDSSLPYIIEGDSPLPPNLTSFVAPHVRFWVKSDQLPSSLTELAVNELSGHLKSLPSGLTALSTKVSSTFGPNILKLLPISLCGLYLHRNPEVEEDSENLFLDPLPPKLTSLGIQGYQPLGDTFVMNLKLEQLLTLVLEDSEFCTDLCISRLNRHLTTLILPKSPEMSGKCFPHLPRGLTSLNFGSSSIYDQDIQHLPRTLLRARLRSAVHLTDACIRDLPRGLKTLHMIANQEITTRCFSDLPTPLKFGRDPFRVAKWHIRWGKICYEPVKQKK